MTALDQYAKLEAVAQYRANHTAPAMDVIISFGERSLIIMRMDDIALAHWPLASLRLRGYESSEHMTLIPYHDSEEQITLADSEMIAAIAAVCPDLRTPRPSAPVPVVASTPFYRRPFVLMGTVLVLVLAAYVFLDRVPPRLSAEQTDELGLAMLEQSLEIIVPDKTGSAALCVDADGRQAIEKLISRLYQKDAAPPDLARHVLIIDADMALRPLGLPGGWILLGRDFLQKMHTPEEIAGIVSHQIALHAQDIPIRAGIEATGLWDRLQLWLGAIPGKNQLSVMVQAIMAGRPTPAQMMAVDKASYAMLARAGLPVLPFAQYIATQEPASPERIAQAKAADRIGNNPFTPALSDRDWLALRDICHHSVPFAKKHLE